MDIFTLFLLLIRFIIFTDYTTYANINIDEKGFRRLLCNGYRYGQYYKYSVTDDVCWKCTTNVLDPITGKRRPCSARIRTKMFNGFEMVKNPNTKHDHWIRLLIHTLTKLRSITTSGAVDLIKAIPKDNNAAA